MNNRIVLALRPETWVRIVSGKHGDHVLFNIPEVCLKGENGGCCDDYFKNGFCKHTLSPASRARKRRIERYNRYRLNLFQAAKDAGFQLPSCGMALYFYFPIPVRWTKIKKAEMHGQLHEQKPDESNLLKAFEDSLSIVDEQIAQMSGLGKFWFNPDLVEPHLRQGYIEILTNQPLYNPFGVEFSSIGKKISMENLEESREKRKARREELRRLKKEKEKREKTPPKKIVKPVKKRGTDELK